MKIIHNHPLSKNGVPVILDDYGNPYRYPEGLRATLDRLGWSKEVAALKAGYETAESRELLWSSETPPIRLLETLGDALASTEREPETE